MANHDGGRMLNHVIGLLRRDRVFERVGRSRSQQLVLEVVKHADHEHDCMAHEILEGHGAALGLCSNCLSPRRGVGEDLCRKCRAEIESLDGGAVTYSLPPSPARRKARRAVR